MKRWFTRLLAVMALSVPMMMTASVYASTEGAAASGAKATQAQVEKKAPVKKAKRHAHHKMYAKKHLKAVKKTEKKAEGTGTSGK